MISAYPIRKTQQLRRGRVSLPGTRYFLTLTCVRPATGLMSGTTAEGIKKSLALLENDQDATILASTIMPDHIHILLQLGNRLQIGQVVGKFKAKTRAVLAGQGLSWQDNFYEHRLRPDEWSNAYAFYIFMNPYRAKLIDRMSVWPHWYAAERQCFDFQSLLKDGKYPPAEWIDCDISQFGLDESVIGE